MRRVDAAWLAAWAAAGVGFYVADRRGVALCASVRYLFRTHTPAGQLALDGFLGVGVLVLRRHLSSGE